MATNSTTNPAPNPMTGSFNPELWNNTVFTTASASATAYIGQIIQWAGPSSKATTILGSNWLLCDGSTVLKANYPSLYALIGDLYGSSGITEEFRLPSFLGAFPIGAADTTNITFTYNGVPTNSGGDSVISQGQLPAHSHTTTSSRITSVNGTSKSDGIGSAVGQVNYVSNVTTNSTGSGQEYLPPFQCINFYIKAK